MLTPQKESLTNLDSILKSRDITLPTTVHLVETLVFPAVMYGCESWMIKKAEHQRIDAFELWCWRRLLRVTWTTRRSNQSILKEISPEYSLEALMLKLKLQYFDHLMRRTDSLEKTPLLGKTEGKKRSNNRGWDCWMASLTQWTWVWVWASSGSWWTGKPGVLRSMESMLEKTECRRSRGQQRIRWLDGITDSMDMSLNKLQELMDREEWHATCSRWGCKEAVTTVTEMKWVFHCIYVPCLLYPFINWWTFRLHQSPCDCK